MEVIPADVKLLTALESLDLSDNRLSRLPPLNTLKKLRRLDIVRYIIPSLQYVWWFHAFLLCFIRRVMSYSTRIA